MKQSLAAALVCFAIFTQSSARADEITLVAPGGIRAAIEKMIPAFEQKTGHKVKATFGSGLGTKRQVAQGEPFDVPIAAKSISYPDPAGGAAGRGGNGRARQGRGRDRCVHARESARSGEGALAVPLFTRHGGRLQGSRHATRALNGHQGDL
jgi:hypothetical protein